MQRREFIGMAGLAVAWPLRASAQSQGKIWRIGFLSGSSRPNVMDTGLAGAFIQGMRELGYTEGKNFLIEWRFAEGRYDAIPKLAAELVALKVDVIVLGTPAAIRPAQQATSTIPIVMGYSVDPVGSGFVASLARPGGNTTGLASSLDESVPKQMELLVAAVPGLARIGLISNPGNRHASALSAAEAPRRERLVLRWSPWTLPIRSNSRTRFPRSSGNAWEPSSSCQMRSSTRKGLKSRSLPFQAGYRRCSPSVNMWLTADS
jgi:hypothetical protein